MVNGVYSLHYILDYKSFRKEHYTFAHWKKANHIQSKVRFYMLTEKGVAKAQNQFKSL